MVLVQQSLSYSQVRGLHHFGFTARAPRYSQVRGLHHFGFKAVETAYDRQQL